MPEERGLCEVELEDGARLTMMSINVRILAESEAFSMSNVTEKFNRTFADDTQEGVYLWLGIWTALVILVEIGLLTTSIVLALAGSD